MIRLLLVNPNTSKDTTAAMLDVARAAVSGAVTIDGMTAPFGVPLIVDEAGLRAAASAVASLVPRIRSGAWDGVIVAAFGDPALDRLREDLACPVTGLAEAALLEAAAGRRPFAVVTTTPALTAVIEASVDRYGLSALFRGTTLPPGDPVAVMADPAGLRRALLEACAIAVANGGPKALIVGGGPLAAATRTIAPMVRTPLIEPVSSATRRMCLLASKRPSSSFRTRGPLPG